MIRALLVALLAVGALSASPKAARPLRHQRDQTAEFNEYLDQLLPELSQLVIDNGLDPVDLPDHEQTFSTTGPLGITWHGELGLVNGYLSGLSNMSRSGDALLTYEDLRFDINVTIAFPIASLYYEYEMQLMDIGPAGSVTGTIEGLTVHAELVADLSNLTSPVIELGSLYFAQAGDIVLEFDGGILEWLAQIIADIVTSLFHDQIINLLEERMREVVQQLIANLDLGDLLPVVVHIEALH